MNLQRHDISIKTSEEEGFDIYVLYHPSVSTRSATHEQPEEFSEVEIEGVYYSDSDRKLSPEHMARLPYERSEWLDVKEIDWEEGTEEGAKCNRNGCVGKITIDHSGCSCHINPPCSYCMEDNRHCPTCGWIPSDDERYEKA